ncbi:PDZ domain-containing protein [Candidatus Microgenomates bacterium]|nr:MAG: PDZ domain-containing protein [Candidatus Microgenomates bacterium]
MKSQRTLLILALVISVFFAVQSGVFGFDWQDLGQRIRIQLPKIASQSPSLSNERVKIIQEESTVINIVERVSPSVVTIGISTTRTGRSLQLDPFDPFNFFREEQGQPRQIEQDIGSGFIVSEDGLIITNKHVVSETGAKYRVITKDGQQHDVQNIYRDPSNDLAILKINASGLVPIEMGDSSTIRVGQFAMAIGTALGEFRNTVTTGVISGVGRGIDAGSPFQGFGERLDDVIQTDAAINPGNSGGPLLNSSGQVVGVNVAIASSAQNIGFAIPINVVKEAIDNFNQTGQFSRPYLGVRYQTISRDVALLNDVPEGALIREVLADSPASRAGLQEGDIITRLDNERLTGENTNVAQIIASKKVGDTISVTYWRDGNESTVTVSLAEQSQ